MGVTIISFEATSPVMRKEVDCPECFTAKTRTLQGEIICTQCGLVLEHIFVSDAPVQETDHHMIGGLPIPPKRIHLGYIYSRKERQYLTGKKEIVFVADYLRIPKVITKEALRLWKECVDNNLCEGRTFDRVTFSCLYLALLIHKEPVEKLSALLPLHTFEKTAQKVSSLLNVHTVLPKSTGERIVLYGTQLKFPQEIVQEALYIERNTDMSYKTKRLVSLGILYYLAKKYHLNLTLLDFCRLGNTPQKSIRTIYNTLRGVYDGED